MHSVQNTCIFFWQYKVYADILGGGFPGEGASNNSGVTWIFRAFGSYVFGTLGNEANIIKQYYFVPCRLSTDPKIRDLK